MKKSLLFWIAGSLLFLGACSGNQSNDATAGEEEPGMEQFAGDESFQAAHAFANPSNPHFDPQAAERANELAWAFLKERL